MTPQEIQLLSDTVKIGFPVVGTIAGALIGGISTYILTKLGHKHDRKKELTKRRFDLLMQTANDVTEFELAIGNYSAAVGNKIQGIKSAIDYDEAKTNVHNKNQPIRRARMSLKILGLVDAERELDGYLDSTREIMRFNINLSKDRASELNKIISAGPISFYAALAKEIELT